MKKLIFMTIICLFALKTQAQIEAPVKWAYAAQKISATEAVVVLKATIQDGWHIYSANLKEGGPIKTSFTFTTSKDYSLMGKVSEPAPLTKFEKAFNMNVTYFEKTVTFQQKIKLKSARVSSIKGKLEYMTCNDKKCLPPDEVNFDVPLSK